MCSVKHYGKIIIAETHLPPEIKTIKPASAPFFSLDRRLLFSTSLFFSAMMLTLGH